MTRAIVLRAAGTNCDKEALHALALAGAQTELVHVRRVIEQPSLLDQFQVLMLPGGFSYGDDVASGKVLANELAAHLADGLQGFVARGGVVIGVCNGFQVLVKMGLLRAENGCSAMQQNVTLTDNDSDRFECRWIQLEVTSDKSPLLEQGMRMDLPVAHGEGKFVAPPEVIEALEASGQVVLRYLGENGSECGYPSNPNGSVGDIAGICDATGRVLGMMPHPERYVSRHHHPQWTRGAGREPGDGLALFRNAVRVGGSG